MALTAERRALLEERLARAEDTYDRLMNGENVQSVGSDGRTTAFTPADAGRLQQYITSLKQQLGLVRRGPITPYF